MLVFIASSVFVFMCLRPLFRNYEKKNRYERKQICIKFIFALESTIEQRTLKKKKKKRTTRMWRIGYDCCRVSSLTHQVYGSVCITFKVCKIVQIVSDSLRRHPTLFHERYYLCYFVILLRNSANYRYFALSLSPRNDEQTKIIVTLWRRRKHV